MKTLFPVFLFLALLPRLMAQKSYWQQQVKYTIHTELDDKKHLLTGTEKIEYQNNSDDTLNRLFFHIYWNSLKSNSDAARWVKETNDFMTDEKMLSLKKNEEGSQEVSNLKVNGESVTITLYESILEARLSKPVLPHSSATIELDFVAQVPVSIRRSGRDNPAGTDYSMCQWYPKICRYDKYGWHADPYIGREFAGTFGSFDVTITLDKKYTVAGTGMLQGKSYKEKGYSNTDETVSPKGNKTSWHFIADNVHDFAWACDDSFHHEQVDVDGIRFHFFYHKDKLYTEPWAEVIKNIEKAYGIARDNFGAYPYGQFSFIQAGEGYMEYPMCTFLEKGSDESFMGTAFHEFMHAWFYGIFGTDENMFHWMDEGMTSYAESRLYYGVKPTELNLNNEAISGYDDYRNYTVEEPASTFANYFKTSEAYILSAYYKGQLFVEQLRYIIGEENVKKGFRQYYQEWKFRHPEPDDFVKIMEDVSGIELSWYQNYWLSTTKVIDYAVDGVSKENDNYHIVIKRIGSLPMPLDVEVKFADGSRQLYYIPLDLMYGKKPHDQALYPYERTDMTPWSFATGKYDLIISTKQSILSIKIDPLKYMADINRSNNRLNL